MPERIVIEEQGCPKPTLMQVPAGIDLQDCLLVLGIASGETACAVIWWPSSLILACLFCFTFAWLIERAKKAKS